MCQSDWNMFADMLKQTPPGNDGNIGLYYLSPEITPTTGAQFGTQRYDEKGQKIISKNKISFLNPAHDVRAVVEGKFLAMRYYGETIGMDTLKARRIIATGGASNNIGILQVLSDVFGCPVYTLAQSDSASLGAAFRALHGHVCHMSKGDDQFVKYEQVISEDVLGYHLACKPTEGTAEIYAQMLPRFAAHQSEFAEELRGKC